MKNQAKKIIAFAMSLALGLASFATGVCAEDMKSVTGVERRTLYDDNLDNGKVPDNTNPDDAERYFRTEEIIDILEDENSGIKTLRFKDSTLPLNDSIKITRDDEEISADELQIGMVVTCDAEYELECYPSIICGCTTINVEKSISVYCGDFDYDGKVTLKDAKICLRLALGIESITDEQKLFGDIDGEGISLTDAKEYLRMSLGIVSAEKKSIFVNIPGETRKYESEDKKVEAVKVTRSGITKYFSYVKIIYEHTTLSAFYEIDKKEKGVFGAKITLMNLFDMKEDEFDNYDYFVGSYSHWCDKFGYDNLKVSLKEEVLGTTIFVENSTPYFSDEIGGEGVNSIANAYTLIFRIPKEEFEERNWLWGYYHEYNAGFSKVNDIIWSFYDVPDVNAVTQSACLVTTESAVPENLRDKCDFEKNDYILMTVPFNAEDCHDWFFWLPPDSEKTVSELYHEGTINKPINFDSSTYLNDKVWVNDNAENKELIIKNKVTIYTKLFYEDIGNCGTALIKVEKGRYRDYEINTKLFEIDFSLSRMV